MGQRSLLVIRYATENRSGGNTVNHRIARHFQWNWGHFMILRAAQTARLMDTMQSKYYSFNGADNALGAAATFCVNQTTGDVQGLGAWADESAQSIEDHDNNNGAFLLDIDVDGSWTFGFLIGHEDDGDLKTVTTASEYLRASRSVLDINADENDIAEDDVEQMRVLKSALAALIEFEGDGHAMTQQTADELAQPIPGDATDGAALI